MGVVAPLPSTLSPKFHAYVTFVPALSVAVRCVTLAHRVGLSLAALKPLIGISTNSSYPISVVNTFVDACPHQSLWSHPC